MSPKADTNGAALATAAPRVSLHSRLGSGPFRILLSLVGVVLFILFAQAVSLWGPANWRVPGAVQFVQDVISLVTLPSFVVAVIDTIVAVLLAILIATGIALVVGLLFGSLPKLAIVFGLPLEIIRPIPAISLIPLAILVFGQGQAMEVALAALVSWWPMLFNTIYGVRQVDRLAIDAARAMGLGPIRIALRVVLPSLLPFLIAGLRTAMPLALVVVIGAEYLSTAQRGLGGVLIVATSSGQLSVLWATAAIAGVLGIILGALVEVAGRFLAPWAAERDR